MAYVPVPKDLTKIKTKIAFNLTQRQLVFIGSAAIFGVPIYFLAKNYLSTDLATLSMIFVMLPFFAFALYEKDGLKLEKVIANYMRVNFIYPKVRPYQTENLYSLLVEQNKINEEMAQFEKQENAQGSTKKTKKKKNKKR